MVQNIDWEKFTREEKDKLLELVASGSKDNLAIVIDMMTPAKEYELQKISDQLRPEVDDSESAVLKNYSEKNPNGPQSPEEEAKLQAELDAEVLARQEKQKADSEARLSAFKVVPEDEAVVPAKEPVAQEPSSKVPFCDQCASKGVRHLKDCPKNITK